jgi:hypothetical protein
MIQFQVGNIIEGHGYGCTGVVREITEVRETGYTWRYLHTPDKEFDSENSTDPMLELGWRIKE